MGAAARILKVLFSRRIRPIALVSLATPALLLPATYLLLEARPAGREKVRTLVQDTVALYGPRVFATPNGAGTNHVEQFSLSPTPDAQYRLRIESGNANGTQQPDTVTVRLNGALIATTADLQSQVVTTRPVEPRSANTIEVMVGGAAGAFVRVTLISEPNSSFLVFGPQTYIRNSGTPDTETHQFHLPEGAGPPFRVHIMNGTDAGVNRVSSGTIKLNGSEILTSTELNPNVASLVKEVTLLGTNTLEVTLKGKPDGILVLSVTATDAAPPVLNLSAPTEGLITREDELVVSGMVEDQTATRVTVNGVEASIGANGAFSATIPLSNDGSHTIQVHAIDAAGLTAAITRNVTRDQSAPSITLTSPADELITRDSIITIAGTVTDATPVIANVNGTPLTVAADGSFTGTLAVNTGSNVLTLTATDAAGNATTLIRQLTRDNTPPSLSVSSPPDGFVTSAESVLVSGTAIDQTHVDVTVNGMSVAPAGNGAFSVTAALAADGQHSIHVKATDAAGQTTELTRNVTRDRTAPVVVISSPSDGLVTRDSVVTVTGSVTDATDVTVTVNGTAFTVDEDGSFTGTVAVSSGPTVVSLTASDAAGNATTVTRQVIRDNYAPSLIVSSPADGLITKADSVKVIGFATDQTRVDLTVNGYPVPVGIDGSFDTTIPVLVGSNAVVVVARDVAGNEQSIARAVVRDTAAPTLTIEGALDGITVNAASITVRGTITDAHAINLTVNGAVVPVVNGTFATELTLVGGPNVITLVATDAAGNIRTRIITVTRQSVALPPDPATVAPPIDPTMPTSMFAATEFLYTGSNPIQTGVAPGTIMPMTVAVVRGRVLDREGNALPGVEVTIAGRPEFGKTLSRADGRYDLAVNGGGALVIDFARTGYLPAQRTVRTPWRDYEVTEDVRLVTLDTAATLIDFSAPIQTARASTVTDGDGTRRATMMFEQGTMASIILPNGTEQLLSQLTVRATEYTIGPNGPQSMPSDLPQNTEYTYAMELSADEAIASGADELRFTKPVRYYLENFLNFPVGTVLPVGYYDRKKSTWIASDNGVVLKVLSNDMGVAALDVDGSGQPATAAILANLGITAAEQQQIAQVYPAGVTLWRATMTHFSAWDINLGGFPPANGDAPGTRNPNYKEPGPNDPPCQTGGSIIGCDTQTLGERIGVVGTPFYLAYNSDRVVGRTDDYTLKIPISGAVLAGPVKRIDVTITIAGRKIVQEYPAQPNQTAIFTWDGKDLYGRTLKGRQPVHVRWGNVYDGQYQRPTDLPKTFGKTGDGRPITGSAARREVSFYQEWRGFVGNWDARIANLGGWTLNVHHARDPEGLILGSGERRSASASLPSIKTVAGVGFACLNTVIENGPATSASLCGPHSIAVGPDGSFYITEGLRIRQVTPSGIIRTIAGGGTHGAFSGDGGPANLARVNGPDAVALGFDGSIYFSDVGNARIRKIGPDGIIHTIAGTGTQGFSGDGGPATEAQIHTVHGIAVAPDGSIYFSDALNHRIRMIDPNGIVTTIAGTGQAGFFGDGGPARLARFSTPHGIALRPNGSLVIADFNNRRIREIGLDGIIRTIAGSAAGCPGPAFSDRCGDGGPAIEGKLALPHEVAIAADGSVYFVDLNHHRIRRVSPDGILTTVVGNYTATPGPDGTPALQTGINGLNAVALSPDGTLYLSEYTNARIRKVEKPTAAFIASNDAIAAEDGSVLYVTDDMGRHLRTIHALTGDTLLTFGYDNSGRMVTITDGDQNVTTIERDAEGRPLTIVAPFGQRTSLTLNTDGYLERITNPNNEAVVLEYHEGGLLAKLSDPRNNSYEFTYDSLGRLIRDDDPAGGFKALNRGETADGQVVTTTTALGRSTAYGFEKTVSGQTIRTATGPDGLTSRSVLLPGDTTRLTTPDGMTTTMVQGADPRFGMQAPLLKSLTVSTPSGLRLNSSFTRTVALAQAGNPFSLTTSTDRLTVNGQTWTSVFNAAQRRYTDASPVGRQTITGVDTQGRVVEEQVTGVTPITYRYDAQGRLEAVSQGTRATGYAYDTRGRLATLTDALGRAENYFYDDADRLTRQVLANGREILYGYDAAGNLTSLTPASKPAHGMDYNAVNLKSTYAAPALGFGERPTQFTYNLDRQVTQVIRPDSSIIGFAYDAAGRVESMTLPNAVYGYTYNPATGLLGTISARGISVNYAYDGNLPTQTSWTGQVAGSVGLRYDNNFRITRQLVNGTDSVSFGYDNDGLLTAAGALTISRSPQNGLLTGTTLGNTTTAQTYDAFGELETFTSSHAGTPLFSTSYVRDALGRITRLTESRGATSKVLEFAYDSIGQLTTVRTDGVVTEAYEYDGNGNRERVTTASGSLTATFDAQDRLLTHGSISYQYTPAGELKERIAGADTTRYSYDAMGNLLQVRMPDGAVIEYVVDGLNRRIGRKVNGTLERGWLYGSQLSLAAELNGAGQVVSRFVYGTRNHVPEYMIRSGVSYRLITDHIGSVRFVVNSSTGEVVQELAYDAFGRVTLNTNPGLQPFAFAGGMYDSETKLVRFGARDYDTDHGRWTVKDPIGFAGGTANLYAYVGNDPINSTDRTGLCPDGSSVDDDCSLKNLLDFTVTAGAQFGLEATVGGYGAYVQAQVGPVMSIEVTEEELLIEEGGYMEGGMVFGPFLNGGINWNFGETTGESVGAAGAEGGVGHSKKLSKGKNGTVFKAKLGLGFGLNPEFKKMWNCLKALF